ncbi:MAG TPA: alpha/beta hydrolase family protein [Bacillota bacterium]|nr:alpha/beta hydrolase family protein [Bacillota bacterium]
MALIQCDFISEVLQLSTTMNVILPQQPTEDLDFKSKSTDIKYPTLYLLHGLSDDQTAWVRRTKIEEYASSKGIAVVMPAVHRSFYTDMAKGLNYWTFISEEVPTLARSFFPLSDKREDNFAAGLSMGGYGAFKLVLNHPDRFAAGASLSGAVDIDSIAKNNPSEKLELVFGNRDKINGSENDLFHLAGKVADSSGPKPKLFQCCGTEDFLYKDNIRYRDFLRRLELDLTYEEGPGTHEWGYWDMMIGRVLDWLPIGQNEG